VERRKRLDQALRELRPDLSWARIRSAILRGQVHVDGVITRDPSTALASSSAIDFDPSRRALRHARLDLPRLYEDEDILIVDKPAGLLSVPTDPALKHSEDTVLRRVQEYARHLHGRRAYAGVLHRLDRDTSGALAVALSREAHRRGRQLFAAHQFDRWYLALVHGVPQRQRGRIEGHISDTYVGGRRRVVADASRGRHAVTHYRVIEAYGDAALLELQLETGRQHQIRLHLQKLGHPLLGEAVYTDDVSPVRAPRQMLHAWRVAFPHPLRDNIVSAEAPLPADMARVRSALSHRRSV
jgi:23S rRNA pseudouridine1911/1915/1917 synthase